MSVKDFFVKTGGLFLWGNLLAMLLVVVLLSVGVWYGLELYTHHGEGIVVPNIKGKSFQVAYRQLQDAGLVIQVSDSGYNKKLAADCILAQSPGFGTKVKEGHTIYVTVNSPSSPTFVIPDIVDNCSVREAEARLTAMGFRLLPSLLVVGEKDWVYGIQCRGRRVSNGDRIPIDYPLTLMVGSGSYDDTDNFEYIESSYAVPSEGEVDEFVEVPEKQPTE